MKIAILATAASFNQEQLQKLRSVGDIVFLENDQFQPPQELIGFAQGATILGADPDPLGGFEKATENLNQVMDALPELKMLCLSTTSYGWVDLEYCRKRGIAVSNIPGYSRESVAEHVLGLLLSLAKRIIVTDRKTRQGSYKLEQGFELKGKILGIIGLGNIGSRVAELGQAIGMQVIAHNPSPRQQAGVAMKTFDQVLSQADALSFNLKDSPEIKGMIGKSEIKKMKDGVIIVNTVGKEIIDEHAMAEALASGKIFGYAYEGEDLDHTPLAQQENAVGLKGFGWYTRESIANLYQIWTNNIVSATTNKPEHTVS